MAATAGFVITAGLASTVGDVARFGGAAIFCAVCVIVFAHIETADREGRR